MGGEEKYLYSEFLDTDISSDQIDILVHEKGFYIKPSQLFCNVLKECKAGRIENLNVLLNDIFRDIERSAIGKNSEEAIRGLFFSLGAGDSRLGENVQAINKKLAEVIVSVADMDLGDHSDQSIDMFGDAYEYLMSMYASNAGKSGGEFFTPQGVSELLARITTHDKKQINKVYDPCCGSGSMLLKFAKVLGKENVTEGFYGQEINHTTYNLCRMNMFLHGINYNKFHIAYGDVLTNPQHDNFQPFEAIVSNPPYSIKWEGKDNINFVNDARFSKAGALAPKSNADLAFTLHMLSYLAPNGTCAIVQFPGVFYREGAEKIIREYLVKNNFIDAVIALPENLFFGTSIATSILVLRRNKRDNQVFFYNASEECTKDGKKNILTDAHIQKILEVYSKREVIEHYSALVSCERIEEQKYNLSVNRYVKPKDTREQVDIHKLNEEISKSVARQNVLRGEIDRIVASLESGDIQFCFDKEELKPLGEVLDYERPDRYISKAKKL